MSRCFLRTRDSQARHEWNSRLYWLFVQVLVTVQLKPCGYWNHLNFSHKRCCPQPSSAIPSLAKSKFGQTNFGHVWPKPILLPPLLPSPPSRTVHARVGPRRVGPPKRGPPERCGPKRRGLEGWRSTFRSPTLRGPPLFWATRTAPGSAMANFGQHQL